MHKNTLRASTEATGFCVRDLGPRLVQGAMTYVVERKRIMQLARLKHRTKAGLRHRVLGSRPSVVSEGFSQTRRVA